MKKLKNYLIGTGLGLTGFLYGCAPMTPDEQQKRDERLLMFVLGYGAIVEPNPQRAAAMGLTSQILRDRDVAREGKSEQKIIIKNYRIKEIYKREPEKVNRFFELEQKNVFGSWEEFAEYQKLKEEITGEKKLFKSWEEFAEYQKSR